MDCVVMTRHPQCQRVGMTAYDCGVGGRQFARWFRQPRFASRYPGALGRKRNLKLRLACNSTQTPGHGALERFVRGLLGRDLGFDVRGHRGTTLYFPKGRTYVVILLEDFY